MAICETCPNGATYIAENGKDKMMLCGLCFAEWVVNLINSNEIVTFRTEGMRVSVV